MGIGSKAERVWMMRAVWNSVVLAETPHTSRATPGIVGAVQLR
jgi:hypothetical protein